MEKRGSPRRRTFKGGSISSGAEAGIDCIIRNLSETGAAVELEGPATMPDNLILLIRPEIVRRNCRVVWRSGRRVGIQFT